MNIKKLFAILAGVSMVANVTLPGLALAATPDTELGKAYEWAYSKGITTMDSYEKANMTANITRAEMAKMLSVYAKNFLGKKADTSKTCTFSDIDTVKGDLHDYIIESCQLGIMGQGITEFRPYDSIPRSEFGTALSRALWGDEYNGGTPFYAKHLVALQSAGIMTQIDNAENRKEVRGYVMIMLQRAEEGWATVDCSESTIALACLDPELDAYKDCPAACRADDSKDSEKEDTKVRSGDLAVSAKAADGRKALIGGVSDLDTLTFKTSEEVTISSVTLERYGYSTIDQVETVQLEDEDGNIIADAKELNNKGQVKLTLKKDYKTVDGTFKATVVVTTKDLTVDGKSNGSTLGFKVVDADSSAKNLNLDDYDPYTYDLVNYKGSAVEFSSRNSAEKTYNWEAGELYEVAKFRVKAPADASIIVKGFTLSDVSKKDPLDANKYAKDVKVTVDGKEVKGLKWNINKDDELVISFDEVEVEGKKTATIAVSMSFNEEFDNFNTVSQYYIKQLSNFNAIDKKTGTRVSQSDDAAKQIDKITWTKYTFKWGKIKISGSKLWTINAAANATNVKVAEWDITVTETVRGSARIAVKSNDFIDGIRLVISGEEYDGTSVKASVYVSANGAKKGDFIKETTTSTTYYLVTEDAAKTTDFADVVKEAVVAVYEFKGLEIEESGKVEVRVDIKDNATDKATMEFAGSLNSASFDLQYEESRETVGSQLIGSISLSSVKVQAAKASLDNKSTKKVELVVNETNRKTIFDGTYEAKKGAVTLKNFVITSTASLKITPNPTFYVTIDGEEYDADFDTSATMTAKYANGAAVGDIDDIEIADGKSVNVKVEIEVTPTVAGATIYNTFNLALEWEDEDNNKAGEANDDTVRVEVVTQGTIDVTDSSAKKTVLLRSNREVAQFKIKPSKSSDDDIILNTMELVWTDTKWGTAQAWSELKFDIDGDNTYTTTDGNFTALGLSVPAEGLIVKVTLKSEFETATKRYFKVATINGKAINSEFSKYYVPAIVKVTQNNGKGKDTTTYTAELDNDTSYTVADLKLYIDQISGACPAGTVTGTVTGLTDKCIVASKDSLSEGSAEDNKFSANNADSARSVTAISYTVNTADVVVKKTEFENFFEKAYGDDDLMVYSNKS